MFTIRIKILYIFILLFFNPSIYLTTNLFSQNKQIFETVTIKLPFDITVKIPQDWEVFDDDKRIFLQELVEKYLDLSKRESSNSNILIAANYPAASETAKMIMNIRYYGDIGIESDDLNSFTDKDLEKFDNDLMNAVTKGYDKMNIRVIRRYGTKKIKLNNLTALETGYVRKRNNDLPFVVKLVRIFSSKGVFTLTLSYKEDVPELKRRDLDLIKESINVN